jgi:hypothetical protein
LVFAYKRIPITNLFCSFGRLLPGFQRGLQNILLFIYGFVACASKSKAALLSVGAYGLDDLTTDNINLPGIGNNPFFHGHTPCNLN